MAIKTIKELVDQANKEIVTLTTEEALAKQRKGDAILVDIRDIRELTREGKIANAVHAPRGMLEFWFDPQSPYHREVFGNMSKEYVLFCAAGWRSALAAKTLKDMGFTNIAHIEGGFGALKEDGAQIISQEPKAG
ncbi:MAG: rhodanese-like domain-containing protein [Salaquimonas sp.]